jgi:mRNA interferase MazF
VSTKDFMGWHTLKQSIEIDAPLPTFKEREVWWCSIGVNVGHETDGKHHLFHRPVLVVKKFNKRIFWGVAMTTQIKESRHYLPIDFKGRKQCVMLSHLRLYDAKRLHDLMGTLPHKQFEGVKTALREQLL